VDYFNKKISYLESINLKKNIPASKSKVQEQRIQEKTEHTSSNQNIASINNTKSSKIENDDDITNLLMTKSVATVIEQINSLSNDYMPKKVNKTFVLPIVKSTPEYKKIKEEIISNIEDGICELEYFNIDEAKEYVECSLYYLKNIIEK